MDVLRVGDEDVYSWELWRLTSALSRGISEFLKKNEGESKFWKLTMPL
jgi:hypothetical protein